MVEFLREEFILWLLLTASFQDGTKTEWVISLFAFDTPPKKTFKITFMSVVSHVTHKYYKLLHRKNVKNGNRFFYFKMALYKQKHEAFRNLKVLLIKERLQGGKGYSGMSEITIEGNGRLTQTLKLNQIFLISSSSANNCQRKPKNLTLIAAICLLFRVRT